MVDDLLSRSKNKASHSDRVNFIALSNLLNFSCSCLIEEDGASFSDSLELRGLARLSKVEAAAAAFASAFIAKGDLICKGYCGKFGKFDGST